MNEVSKRKAQQLAKEILKTGEVRWSDHIEDRAWERDLESVDCVSVVRCGKCVKKRYEDGSWRYEIHTERMGVSVAFHSETVMEFVTVFYLS